MKRKNHQHGRKTKLTFQWQQGSFEVVIKTGQPAQPPLAEPESLVLASANLSLNQPLVSLAKAA